MRLTKARTLVILWLASLPPSIAQAQTIDAPQVEVGSIQDNPKGGDPEQLLATPYISLQTSREWRAFVSFDVSAVAGRYVASAKLKGTIGPNNALDTGTRTMNLEIFGGSCTLALTDFAASVTTVGSVSYDPPYATPITFDLEIAPQLRALLQQNPACIKLRVRSTVNDAPNVIADTATSLTIELGSPDAGVPDATVDSGPPDKGVPDTTVDSGPPDTATPPPDTTTPSPDAARDDAPATADAFVADTVPPPGVEAGVIVTLRDSGGPSDAPQGDGESGLTQSSGCSCKTSAGHGAETLLSLLLVGLVLISRRRGRSSR